MKTQAQKQAEFMRRMYKGGCQHDSKMTRLAWSLIAYACGTTAAILYYIY